MASAMEIVKYFCEQKEWKYSNLALQKLLYLTNVIYIGKHKEALMPERFQAWSYGPVCPPIYHKLKIFGANPVKPMTFIKKQNNIDNDREHEVCTTAVRLFGDMQPTDLIQLTHRENSVVFEDVVGRMLKI